MREETISDLREEVASLRQTIIDLRSEIAYLKAVTLSESQMRGLDDLIDKESKAKWARDKLRVVLPWGVSVITGAWFFIDWLVKHVRWGSAP